jgi:hypothetical protein
MPLVISQKAKWTFYVKSEETLGEILGHSNFDGEDWAVGDAIIFEEGTRSTIQKHEQFHIWSDPKPAKLDEVLSLIQGYDDPRLTPNDEIDSWAKLFQKLSVPLPRTSWWRTIFP